MHIHFSCGFDAGVEVCFSTIHDSRLMKSMVDKSRVARAHNSASPLQTEWTGSATFHGQKTVSPHFRMIQPLPNLLSRSTRTHSPTPPAGNEMHENPADRVTGVPIEDCLPEIITIYDSSDEAEESDDDEVEFISERVVIPIDDDEEEELYVPLNRPNVAPAPNPVPNPAPVTDLEYAMDIVSIFFLFLTVARHFFYVFCIRFR